MKKENIQQFQGRIVILTAVFFMAFCRIVSAQDIFEAKNPDEPKTSEEIRQARAAKQTDVEKQPESPAPAATEKPLTADDVQKAFEKALKAVDSGKLEDEKILEELLHKAFRTAVEDWMDTAREKRAPDLNRKMSQKWEMLYEFGPYIHYDYYLRDYEFLEKGSDIIKTDSMTTPYRAYVNVAEKLYVEKYHTPDISYIEDFLYTVTYLVKIDMEYRGDKFIIVKEDRGQMSIEKGWPVSVSKKLIGKVLVI